MKALRLTAHNRRAIRIALIAHGTEQEAKEINQEQSRIADAAYKELYAAPTRKRMNDLPKGWLRTAVRIDVNDPLANLSLDGPRPFLDQDLDTGYCGGAKLKKPSTALVDAIRAHQKRSFALAETRNKLDNQILVLLEPITTWAKFKDVWPEAHEVVKDLAPAQADHLPMVIPTALNAALQLGTKKVKLAQAA